MPLPGSFCWTRFGTEAGEEINNIFARKNEERRINEGVFLWGIGNSIGPSIKELIRLVKNPEVVFSPIRSAPRKEDVSPEQVVAWTEAETIWGDAYIQPSGSVVTSRLGRGRKRISHYALVCASDDALEQNFDADIIFFRKLRNLKTDRPLAASQVTAVVRHTEDGNSAEGLMYRAVIRTKLVYPYFIRLLAPIPMPTQLVKNIGSSGNRNTLLLDFLRKHRANTRSKPASIGELFA